MATESNNYRREYFPFVFSTVLITLMSMITSVGTPYITNAFGLTSQQAPWITTPTTMATAILAPLLGWVGDKFGVKKQLLIGIACEIAGNIISSVAATFALFCTGRFLGGIGMAAAYPATMSFISNRFPKEKRVGGFAALGALICLGSGGGPALIGALLEICTWRQLFLYGVIIMVALGAVVIFLVKGSEGLGKSRRIDTLGMVELFAGVGLLLSGLTLLTQLGWSSPVLISMFILSIMLLVLFCRHENRTEMPLIDISLFTSRRFLIPALMGFYIYGFKCYCCTAMPYYLAIGLGKASSLSGIWLSVFFLAGFPLSFFVGKLNRLISTRTMAIIGTSTWVIGVGMFLFFTENTPTWFAFMAAIIPSIGIALLGGMPNACALKNVSPEKSGAASGAISLSSNMGSALVSAFIIPLLSTIRCASDGTPNYVASFPRTSIIMFCLLLISLALSFFFPDDKGTN